MIKIMESDRYEYKIHNSTSIFIAIDGHISPAWSFLI